MMLGTPQSVGWSPTEKALAQRSAVLGWRKPVLSSPAPGWTVGHVKAGTVSG